MRTIVIGFVLGCNLVFLGCGSTAPLDWEDASQVMIITVDSQPSGAAVYGKSGGQTGAYIGTTPLTMKYAVDDRGSWGCQNCGPDIFQTLAPDYHRPPLFELLGTTTASVTFSCVVIKEGFRPHYIEEMAGSKSAWGPVSQADLMRGVRKYYTAVLVPLTPPPQPQQQQQQQQQQQTVIVPGLGTASAEAFGTILLTSDVDNAEVYVDGMFVGNVPASLKLSAGIHVVEVKAVGHQSYKKELRVLANSELSLRAQLKQ